MGFFLQKNVHLCKSKLLEIILDHSLGYNVGGDMKLRFSVR